MYWHENEQDWPLVVCDKGWIPQFIKAYQADNFNDDEKFALIELIIASFDDLAKKESLHSNRDWLECEQILKTEFWLHVSTIHYWSVLDRQNPDDCFSITEYIRPMWDEVKSNFT